MTERVTNVEIEDVLSAIRRLVSEGNPPGARPRIVQIASNPAEPAAPPADDVADAPIPVDASASGPLVLTEAFRVIPAPVDPDGEDLAKDDAATLSDPVDSPSHDGLSDDPAAGDPVSDPAADVMSLSPVPTIAPGSDAILSDDVLDLPFDFRPVEAGRPAETSALSDFSTVETAPMLDAPPDAPAAETTTPAPAPVAPELRLAEMAAELELATCRTAGDWEPDGSEAVPEMDWTAAREDAGHGPVPVFRTRKMPPLQLSPELSVAARSAVEGKVDGTGRPVAFHSSRARPEEPAPTAAAATDAPPQIDDARLRALVLDAVRQELQGPLGERITHNVRKLVRREIFRVLNDINTD